MAFLFAKYPESNHIHKRMLQISRKVHKAVKELGVKSSKLKVQKSKKSSNSQLLTPNLLLHGSGKGSVMTPTGMAYSEAFICPI